MMTSAPISPDAYCARCDQFASRHHSDHPHAALLVLANTRPCVGFLPIPVTTVPCPVTHADYRHCPLCRGTGVIEAV